MPTSEAFLAAVISRDADEIVEQLAAPMFYAGLYFSDPECARRFPTPRRLEQRVLPAFARCLATLPLEPSERADAVYGVAIYEYAPGIELEAVFQHRGAGARVTWIGYSGRRTLRDGLPTITPAALEANRLDGDPMARPTPEQARAIEAESKALALERAFAWFKVCLDAEGNVTGVHEREVTSPKAALAFAAAIQRWRFRPFKFGSQALPACSFVRVSHPYQKLAKEVLPVVFPTVDGAVRIPPAQAKRLTGAPSIVPDDADKVRFQQAGGGTLTGTFSYCYDATGKVTAVSIIEPTGLRSYDALIMREIHAWTFAPYVLDGQAITACTVATFIYTQR